ncbi:MAG: zinc ribbon domain-containing protein [Clostridia bacterium]|nr:zinc ribbon domain-containing protein [Clostridia bacterium]
MQKYCGNCGAQMPKNVNFCGICGTRFNIQPAIQAHKTKTRLTNAVINKDIHNQKHTFWQYLGQLSLLGLMFLVCFLGNPLIMLCSIPWALTMIKMIRDDVRRSNLKYYVLERACMEKKVVQQDDGPDTLQLWFENATREFIVAVEVKQAVYDTAEVGEQFYIVFLAKEKTPCLCYKKSEWV